MKSRSESNQDARHVTRPLQTVTVRLSCGCVRAWPGSVETAPRRGMTLTCYQHMEEVMVDSVSVAEGTR